MGLFTLVYVSAAVEPFSRQQLDELLEHSRTRNSARGITGLLLYRGGNFLQVLEGEEATVLDLKTRIARDPRHTRLIVMLAKGIDERAFGEWSMAFRDLDDPTLNQRPGFSDFLNTDLTTGGIGGRLAPLLESFRRTMR